jgi:hypothetical protein
MKSFISYNLFFSSHDRNRKKQQQIKLLHERRLNFGFKYQSQTTRASLVKLSSLFLLKGSDVTSIIQNYIPKNVWKKFFKSIFIKGGI